MSTAYQDKACFKSNLRNPYIFSNFWKLSIAARTRKRRVSRGGGGRWRGGLQKFTGGGRALIEF